MLSTVHCLYCKFTQIKKMAAVEVDFHHIHVKCCRQFIDIYGLIAFVTLPNINSQKIWYRCKH